ncbi:MAG: hypothetical protein WA867_19095, partial [Candidatus Acidiferrales bacterium]
DEKLRCMTKVFPIQEIGRDDVYTETLAPELRVTDLRATQAREPLSLKGGNLWGFPEPAE